MNLESKLFNPDQKAPTIAEALAVVFDRQALEKEVLKKQKALHKATQVLEFVDDALEGGTTEWQISMTVRRYKCVYDTYIYWFEPLGESVIEPEEPVTNIQAIVDLLVENGLTDEISINRLVLSSEKSQLVLESPESEKVIPNELAKQAGLRFAH